MSFWIPSQWFQGALQSFRTESQTVFVESEHEPQSELLKHEQ